MFVCKTPDKHQRAYMQILCCTSSEGFYYFGHGEDSAEVPVQQVVLWSIKDGVYRKQAGQEPSIFEVRYHVLYFGNKLPC